MFRFMIRDVLWAMLVVAVVPPVALADEWGDLSMRFIYDGEGPCSVSRFATCFG